MRSRARVIIAILAVELLACQDKLGPIRLTVAGSSTIQPILESAASRFEGKHAGVKLDVQGGGSSVGIKCATEGSCDVGMVSRDLKPEERAAQLAAVKVADDGIAIIVHEDNPLAAITREQVVKLYSGAVTSWKDVGGGAGPVTLITKEEGRSTLELFARHFGLEQRIKADAIVIGPNGQAIKTLEGNPDAIGYVSIGSAEKAVEQGSPIKLLPLDGVAATTDNVRNGTYPLRRPLNLVTKGPATGRAKELIDFMLTSEGQQIVADQDFVALAR